MFSFLSRGYGTWEGIAKLEKPDSGISPTVDSCGDYDVLPPIRKNPYHFYDRLVDHDGLYHVPAEELKLPEVPKDSLYIPKTYSTKSGALLLYSEGCFVPGSRKLKKRPRRFYKRQKEKRLQTLKDLMELIMDYKKNGRDPLMLEQLWRRVSGSARDVQPGYSPKRYLSHLSQTTFDAESWKKFVESGLLKSFSSIDDNFLPSLVPDEYGENLHHRPQPYKTMSLPPVSPSSSMLGSFTFYKHALSTGAASMVSLPSVNAETIDEQLSAKTAGTFVESLAERLAEVESEAGFKKDYESLTAKEKEDLLTQLLMDVTLHNQRDVITVPTQTMPQSSTVNTDISYLSDTKDFKSVESLESYHSMTSAPREKTKSRSSRKSVASDKSLKSGQRQKSSDSQRSLKSVASKSSSVCTLPPIVSKDNMSDVVDLGSKKASLSSSRSGLGVLVNDFEVGLDGIEVEVDDDSFLVEDTEIGLTRKDSEARSLRSGKTFSEHSLIDALSIQDGESIHHLTGETKSLKSLGSSHGVVRGTGRTDETLRDGAVDSETSIRDGHLSNDMEHGDGDSYFGDDDGSGEYGITSDGNGGDGDSYSEDKENIKISNDIPYSYTDGQPDDHDKGATQIMPTIDVAPVTEPQAPHISLSSLQDEVRLVATAVLSRPKSGRTLAEDAEMATFLLLERMQGLLDPHVLTDENARVSSAAPKRFRPLGQPRNSEAKEKRRARSADPTLALRNLIKSEEKQDEPVSKPEEKQAEQVPEPEEKQVEQVPESEGKQDEQVSEKPAEPVSEPDEKQPDEISSDVQDLQVKVDTSSKTDEDDLSVDDVIITMDTAQNAESAKEDGTQSLHEVSPTLSLEGELLTVKDLPPDKTDEATKTDVQTMKKPKEIEHKEAKVKKGSILKRVPKKGKKKKSVVRSRNEPPPKTPPFRAGLVPETKPPKGLARKTGGAHKNGNSKQASPELQEKTEVKTEEHLKDSVAPPVIPVRVDSETGEVVHRLSPARSEKSSRTGGKTPSSEKVSVSQEDQASVRAETISPRAQSKSPRVESNSPREDSSHEKTPSPRDKTPSPREQKVCPRDRDAVFSENVNEKVESVNANVSTEEVETPAREPSPEIVLTEKQRRANARAAQRAAAAERRRQEVERKRREREGKRRQAQEEEARLDVLRKEAEEEMKKREEERRIQKEQEDRERMRQEAEQNERARQERLMIERQRQAREEWKRKKEQLVAQRKFEEELRKERERIEAQIEEERRREYAEKIAHLEEEERERLLQERRLEEERIKREIQEEKEQREAERLRMLEERRQMEEELAAARERQLERRTFLESLLRDFQNLLLDQRITRAFTFSYFDIMPWLKDRWRDLEKDRPLSSRTSTRLDPVPEEPENDIEL